nr:hypothetical protein [Tanacetum cinerariifolium]
MVAEVAVDSGGGVRTACGGEWHSGSSRSGDGDRFWVRRKCSPERFSSGGGGDIVSCTMVSFYILRHCELHNGLTSFADIKINTHKLSLLPTTTSPPAGHHLRPAAGAGDFSGEIFGRTPKLLPIFRSIRPTTCINRRSVTVSNTTAAALGQPAPPLHQPPPSQHPAAAGHFPTAATFIPATPPTANCQHHPTATMAATPLDTTNTTTNATTAAAFPAAAAAVVGLWLAD